MRLSDKDRCWLILAITVLFGGLGFWGSHTTNSYGLLGDALHLLGDGLPFVGTLLLAKGFQNEEQGHILEAAIKVVNATFLFASGMYLLINGLLITFHPHVVENKWLTLFATLELVGNSAQAYLAHSVQHVYHDRSTHTSQMLHLYGDIAASGGVLLAALLIWLTGWSAIDTIASYALGAYMLYLTTQIVRNKGHSPAHHHH